MLHAPPPPPPAAVYVDPAGDSGTAPDITKVTVETRKGGVVDFIVVFRTPYGPSSSLYVLVGSDGYRLGPYGLEVWDPPAQEYEPTGDEGTTFSVAPGGRALQASVSLADLGHPKSFAFTVQSLDGGGGTGHMDTLAGAWPGQKVVLSSRQSAAKAGGTWTAELRVVAARATVACKGVKPLTVARRSFAAGTATCVFRVPKTARRTKLAAAVTVTAGGRSATVTFTTTAR